MAWPRCTSAAVSRGPLCRALGRRVRRCNCTTDGSNQNKCCIAVEANPALPPRTTPCAGMTCALVRSHGGRTQSENWLIVVKAGSAFAARTAPYVGMTCAPVPLHHGPIQLGKCLVAAEADFALAALCRRSMTASTLTAVRAGCINMYQIGWVSWFRPWAGILCV